MVFCPAVVVYRELVNKLGLMRDGAGDDDGRRYDSQATVILCVYCTYCTMHKLTSSR